MHLDHILLDYPELLNSPFGKLARAKHILDAFTSNINMDKQAIEEYAAEEKDKTQDFMKKAEFKLEKGGKLSVTDFVPSFDGRLFSNYILDDRKVIIKRYKIRPTGKAGATIETSIPKEAFEREIRKLGLTPKEALRKLRAVWRFNSFRGLHLSFEPIGRS